MAMKVDICYQQEIKNVVLLKPYQLGAKSIKFDYVFGEIGLQSSRPKIAKTRAKIFDTDLKFW